MNNTQLKKLFELNFNNICIDSRKVTKNDLFVAITGVDTNGHEYINQALENGAIAVVFEDDVYKPNIDNCFKVEDSRKALAIISARYYGDVHKKMKLIGITGTNGKTTTCEITYQILKHCGVKVGVISTVGAKANGVDIDTGYHVTTPGALELHEILHKMYDGGCNHAILEVTSHGLQQHRTYGLNFEACGITNITPEHLDYHKTFDNYLNAKLLLTRQSKRLVLNKYDPSLKTILKKIEGNPTPTIVDYKKISIPEEFSNILPGDFNKQNASVALELALSVVPSTSSKLLSKITSIDGRMNSIKNNKGLTVIIDFAHDDESLKNLLLEVKKFAKQKVIIVFGCAGLRDKQKRPKMGKVAQEFCDTVIITAEDPRTETLSQINSEILSGMNEVESNLNKTLFIIDDRKVAISSAINKFASKGDVILITGKGHEKSMCFGITEYPWSDKKAVLEALSN